MQKAIRDLFDRYENQTNAYLTRVENGQAKVFGWITGDEEAELRKHGII